MIRKAVRTAVRLAGGTGQDSSTVVVGAIKPKALSDFAGSTIKLKEGILFKGKDEIVIVDFIKEFLNREKKEEELGDKETKLVEQCVLFLQELNKKHIEESCRYKEGKERKEKNEENIVKFRLAVNDYNELKAGLVKTKEIGRGAGKLVDQFDEIDRKISSILKKNKIDLPFLKKKEEEMRDAENEYLENINKKGGVERRMMLEERRNDLQLSVLGCSFIKEGEEKIEKDSSEIS